MTLKRKLGIGAVLVVIVIAGLLVVFRDSKPDPPFTATFVRYEGSNNAVIRITSKIKTEVHYAWSGDSIALTTSRISKDTLGPFESREVVVDITEDFIRMYGHVRVCYFGTPSRIDIVAWRLAKKIGKEGTGTFYWETTVKLPPRNPPMP